MKTGEFAFCEVVNDYTTFRFCGRIASDSGRLIMLDTGTCVNKKDVVRCIDLDRLTRPIIKDWVISKKTPKATE